MRMVPKGSYIGILGPQLLELFGKDSEALLEIILYWGYPRDLKPSMKFTVLFLPHGLYIKM